MKEGGASRKHPEEQTTQFHNTVSLASLFSSLQAKRSCPWLLVHMPFPWHSCTLIYLISDIHCTDFASLRCTPTTTRWETLLLHWFPSGFASQKTSLFPSYVNLHTVHAENANTERIQLDIFILEHIIQNNKKKLFQILVTKLICFIAKLDETIVTVHPSKHSLL